MEKVFFYREKVIGIKDDPHPFIIYYEVMSSDEFGKDLYSTTKIKPPSKSFLYERVEQGELIHDDIHGKDLFYSEHNLFFRFLLKLKTLDLSSIESFLSFHLDKFQGDKLEWIRYVKSKIYDYKSDIRNSNTKIKNTVFRFLKDDNSSEYRMVVGWLNQVEQEFFTRARIDSFRCRVDVDEIRFICKKLITKKFVHGSTIEDQFLAAFGFKAITHDFKPLVWLKSKSTLNDFLVMISDYTNHKDHYYIPDQVKHDIIPILFIDKYGKGIDLNKQGQFCKDYQELEKLVKSSGI